jgi:hypothetical protein
LAVIADVTKAQVAKVVLLVPALWVVAVVPLGRAGVPLRLDAVPDVLWFRVGKVQFARFPLVGVPSIGVTNVGVVASTLFPVPVLAKARRVVDPFHWAE